jgi:4-carboxymuconolactone decarboxylase
LLPVIVALLSIIEQNAQDASVGRGLMARVPEVTRDDLPEELQPIYDEIAASRGRVSGPFPVMLHSPRLAALVARVGHHVRFENPFEPWVMELVVLTAAREWDCLFEWAAHEPMAAKAGVKPEVIAAIRDRTAPAGFGERETLLVNFVHDLVRRHRVAQPTFDAVRAWLGTEGLMTLSITIGYYSMLACAMDAVEVQPPAGAPVLPVE